MSGKATIDVMLSPLLLSREQVAAVLGGCSASHVDRLERAGRLGPMPVKLGGCVRWRADELREWVEAGCPPRVEWRRLHSGDLETTNTPARRRTSRPTQAAGADAVL